MQITLESITGSGELWLDIMKIICGDTRNSSMVDLGCHLAPYTPLLGFKERTYVDIQERPLDHNEDQNRFVIYDIVDYLKNRISLFDVAIASDVIEHLTQERGYDLLQCMEKKSLKQVLFTPLGAYMVNTEESTNPDIHRSGWMPDLLPNYLCIILPAFHEALNIGAFFAVNCSDEEKQRIYNEIKNKYDKN